MRPVFYERRPASGWKPENVFVGPICDSPFPAHVHEVVEIVCLLQGQLEMTIGGQVHSLRPGDIAFIFPHVPHSYDRVGLTADGQPSSGLSLIFLPDAISEFSRTFRTMQPVSPVTSLRNADSMVRAIVQKMSRFTPEEANRLRLGYLHLFLAYLLSALPLRPMEKSPYTGLCDQVLSYVADHFIEPLTLDTVARALGVSRIHLSHIFSQQLHINFRQYINTLRIDRACTLLRDPGVTVSEVVDLCGYGNPRTFHRAFLSLMGVTPSKYRESLNLPAADLEEFSE